MTATATAVGGLIRAHRQRHKLSLERAAERLGVDHTLLSRIERGIRHPTPRTIKLLEEGYHLTAEERDELRRLWWEEA